jgi:hypothetical protein
MQHTVVKLNGRDISWLRVEVISLWIPTYQSESAPRQIRGALSRGCFDIKSIAVA